MTPNEIRGRLMIVDCKSVEIADEVSASEAVVSQVISGKSTSDRIQRVIAGKLGLPVEEVFPERYKVRNISPRRALQRQKRAV